VLDKPVEKVIRIVNPSSMNGRPPVPAVPADAEKPAAGKGEVR